MTLTASDETHQLQVTGVYSDGASKNFTSSASGTTYSTGDPNVADVTPEGLISVVNDGTTVITVTHGEVSSRLGVTVSIKIIPPPNPTAYINGRVLDGSTGSPVANAAIKELTLSATVNTDAEGKFTFSVPQEGKYSIYINKPGYVTAKRDVIVESGKNAAIEDEYLAPYETFTTPINAALGGTAANAAGTVEMIFPPNALPSPDA